MTPEEQQVLDEVAALIADGLPVAWPALLVRYPEYATQLRELMEVGIIRQTFAGAEEPEADEPEADKT